LPDTELNWKVIHVTEGGYTMPVYIPIVNDRREQHDIDEYAEGSTKAQLSKKQPKPVSRFSKEDIAGELRAYREWFLRRKDTVNRRLF